MYKTVIIGGGAAGLFLGANLNGDKNLIIEGSNKIGKKILITGGGMCNITNMDDTDTFLSKFGTKSKINFLKPAMLNLTTEKTREWLEEIGLELTVREDGKVFPKSLKAQTLIDYLFKKLTANGVKVKYQSRVTKIEYRDDHFEITSGSEIFSSKNIVIATGGKSFPETGSDGSGYTLAKQLKHKVIDPTPALVGVKIENYDFKSISGNAIRSSYIEFFRNGENKRYLNSIGDILFTHQGLSGPGVLNNSREIQNGDIVKISLIPCSNIEDGRVEILDRINSSSKASIKRILKELGLISSLAEIIISKNRVNPDDIAKSLNKSVKSKLVTSLLSYPFKVREKIGFNGAMVTAGGVDLNEINRKTMESKLLPCLYFAGEVLDIDGDTGGYNIQAAFSTAKLVADKLNSEL